MVYYKKQPLLCKDCTHRTFNWIYLEYQCNRGEKVDLVTGKKITSTLFNCSYQRRDNQVRDVCGPEGKYWTPKKKKDLFKLLKR